LGDWYIKAEGPVGGSELRYDALVVLGSSLGQKTTNDWDSALMPYRTSLSVE
jgi:hypothetical protein